MTDKLNEIHINLKTIKDNLVKLPFERRKPELLNTKLQEAYVFYEEYIQISIELDKLIENKEIKGENLILIQDLCAKIKLLYEQIEQFCTKIHIKSNSGGNSNSNKNSTMADFDLKVALSLIPSMTEDEVVIKQLIDSIDYYDSILKTEAKQQLINFVLKNRLTQIAKLKLCASYVSTQALIQDMKKHLLPKKSATAIQNKMQTLRQGESSIDDFGRELSNMFVDLTIAQSDGDDNAYEILKKLNEKQAIKRFADGLRNRRISTIIAARDYESLNDAVQGAKDEETNMGNASGEILTFNRKNNFSRGHRTFARGRGGYFRGISRYYQGQQSTPPPPPPPQPPYQLWRTRYATPRGANRGAYGYRGTSSRTTRGRSNAFRGTNGYRRERIFMNKEEGEEKVSPNQFFRN